MKKTKKRKIPITPRERRFMKQYVPNKAVDGCPYEGRPWLVVGRQSFPIQACENATAEELKWYRWQLAKALIHLVDAEERQGMIKEEYVKDGEEGKA